MSREEVLARLRVAVAEATKESNEATTAFATILRDTPSGLPHPDGVQRIATASAANSRARNNLRVAMNRLHQFQMHGVVPEDLR
jgi:hypothetical protein